ncbi:hypothetical protein [Synechococcus sp. WH 8016]|uniref:hypothetical protein n=1 Tax=Synechococcus sp. WH 8016 TaxID=166318 RepID=UPI00022DA164|nr:hypothetical protein [Synechococcus sp. WH 8016]EHA63748.1 hypothetical protein Syn8016DRAFT_0789 [Synechococcus sp. WH 8016]
MTDIPDKIDFGQLQQYAETATSGISAVDAEELISLCDTYIENLDDMIEKIDACMTSTITPERWQYFVTARKSLKIARRNFRAATRR